MHHMKCLFGVLLDLRLCGGVEEVQVEVRRKQWARTAEINKVPLIDIVGPKIPRRYKDRTGWQRHMIPKKEKARVPERGLLVDR